MTATTIRLADIIDATTTEAIEADRLILADLAQDEGNIKAEVLLRSELPLSVLDGELSSPLLEDVQEAYMRASGEWAGCDWNQPCYAVGHAHYPLARVEIDADGLDGDEDAEDVAVAAIGSRSDWEDLDDDNQDEWLAAAEAAINFAIACRKDAAEAEELAAHAMEAIDRGDWAEAKDHACRAEGIESTYGDCPTWRAFSRAVEGLANAT